MTHKEKLITFLKKYSNKDLLSSFFIINLYLPNISSPIKLQYLYVVYEEIFENLTIQNQINSYIHFLSFYNELINYIPNFHMIEDYIPEQDWGEIKYFFNNNTYKIFYGADLENVYDYYSSLELIHNGNDEIYIKEFNRSFIKEFEFSLKIQDYIIQNINNISINEVSNGDIYPPSKEFWKEVIDFLESNKIKDFFDNDLLNLYSFDRIKRNISVADFYKNVYSGKNCNYFFIKFNNNYYPVLPRKYCTVIYEAWGDNLKHIYSIKLINDHNINFKITKNLGLYLKTRISDNSFFEYLTPFGKNNNLLDFLFSGLIKCKNKLILLYNFPIFHSKNDISYIFDKLSRLVNSLEDNGYKFLLNGQREVIEFKNKPGSLEIFVIIPNISTSEFISISVPKKFPGQIFTLDNFLSIIDEISDIEQLNDYLDFIKKLDKYKMGPYNSQLDKFGAFIDFKGVLIEGANEPTSLFLDPHWGTEFRYKSLSIFWTNFPQHNLFGHPRSWKIENYNEKGILLLSKEFRGFFFCKDIGNKSFFINSLINENIEITEGKISQQMINILIDELEIYKEQINNLFKFSDELKLHIIFCSNSFLNRNINKFYYMDHLIVNSDIWKLDKVYNSIDNILGIRIVFNDEMIINKLSTINNRKLEIDLLYELLKLIIDYLGINEISKEFLDLLESDKLKNSRHGFFKISREASFPEYEKIIIASEKEYKLVTKEIAILLKDNKISPLKYNNRDSIEVVNKIREIILKKIDNYIKKFNFNDSITYIISKNDALHNEYFKNKNRIKLSLEHDKDYKSEEKLYEYYKEYLSDVKNYRFLIEKFIQFRPNSSNIVVDENILKYLLALIDSFLNIQILSDIVNYGINDAGISINNHYIFDIIYPKSLSDNEKEYGIYIEKIKLGIDGNDYDIVEINGKIEDFLDELDNAFILDFGFGLNNLINVLNVLSFWGEYNEENDKSYYIATKDEIILLCLKKIEKISSHNIKKILEFLLLNSSDITTTRGENGEIEKHTELPIWEYNKRIYRYTLQPLIKVKGKIMWGPFSTLKTSLLWQGIGSNYKLPANFNALNILKVLQGRHIEIRKNLELKIQEILSRYTSNIILNLNPKKFDKKLIKDIGDFDVFGFIVEKNIILNIESKLIDNAYCLKDSNRVKEKIYGRLKENGTYQKGYLQKHELRDEYIKNNYEKILRYLNINTPEKEPMIISLFVTKTSSWWTASHIKDVNVKFIEIRLLDSYIKTLLNSEDRAC